MSRQTSLPDNNFYTWGQQTPDDCFSTCLGIILQVHPKNIPNWNAVAGLGDDNAQWWAAVRDWLRPRGWGILNLSVLPNVLETIEGLYIVSGKTPRGLMHATVWLDGKMLHDPHPDASGLTEVESIDLLYPLVPFLLRKTGL
jgi:hypothetical protein